MPITEGGGVVPTTAKVVFDRTGDQSGYRQIERVTFDVAITVTQEQGEKGGLGVVAGFIAGVAQADSREGESKISRIQFTIPIALPKSGSKR